MRLPLYVDATPARLLSIPVRESLRGLGFRLLVLPLSLYGLIIPQIEQKVKGFSEKWRFAQKHRIMCIVFMQIAGL